MVYTLAIFVLGMGYGFQNTAITIIIFHLCIYGTPKCEI